MSSNSKVNNRRSFVADTYSSAELDAKLELGDDFDVIDTQDIIETYFLGLFSKKKVKVTVQYPSKESLRKRMGRSNAKKDSDVEEFQNFLKGYNKGSSRKKIPSKQEIQNGNIKILKDIMSKMDFDKDAQPPQIKKKATYDTLPKTKNVEKIDFKEATEEQQHYQKLAEEISSLRKELAIFAKKDRKNTEERCSTFRKRFYKMFVDNDMPAAFTNNLLNLFEKKLTQDELEDKTKYRRKLREYLIDHIYFRKGIDAEAGSKIAFLGPTGVGKTTTVAKLAYHLKYEKGKEVAVISLDGYKFGGIMQLEDLCDEMGIEFYSFHEGSELEKYIKENNDKIIIVDTAGQNYSKESGSKEINNIIDFTEGFERYLILSSKMKFNDMMRLNDSFSACNLKGVIFSKCDLCKYVGTIIAFLYSSKNNLVYMTFGKKITGDLREAIPYRLVDGILEDEN